MDTSKTLDLSENRKTWANLVFMGCLPEMAAQKFPIEGKAEAEAVEVYRLIKENPAFVEWRDKFVKTFTDFLDGFLLGRIFKISDEIDHMNPIDHPNYARVHAEMIKLLDRTAPIVERMKQSVGGQIYGPSVSDKLTLVDGTPQA